MLGPNITGQFWVRYGTGLNGDSSLFTVTTGGQAQAQVQSSGSTGRYTAKFDAGSFNSVYTDNGNVRSLSLTLNYVIKS